MRPDYEKLLEMFYTSILRPGDCCIDIGAHGGRHTLPMARSVGSSGKVLAFEPIPELASRLHETVTFNPDLAHVRVYQHALSEENGTSDFVVVKEATEYSGLQKRIYDIPVTIEKIKVLTKALDEYMLELDKVHFIKIDCEGSELKVLLGAKNIINRDRPVISFECGDNSLIEYDYDSADIFDFFDGMNYEIQSIEGKRHGRREFVEACRRQAYWDYVATPN